MSDDGLTTRQRCVLYLLFLLQMPRERPIQWSVLDQCFDDKLLRTRETLDSALRVLRRRGLVTLTRSGTHIIAASLTPAGREVGGNINVFRITPFVNTGVVYKLLRPEA